MTGLEHNLAVGEPVCGVCSYPSFVEPVLSQLSSNEQKRFAGNSYDAMSYGYFLMYCLSNVERKSPSRSGGASASSSSSQPFEGAVFSEAPLDVEKDAEELTGAQATVSDDAAEIVDLASGRAQTLWSDVYYAAPPTISHFKTFDCYLSS